MIRLRQGDVILIASTPSEYTLCARVTVLKADLSLHFRVINGEWDGHFDRNGVMHIHTPVGCESTHMKPHHVLRVPPPVPDYNDALAAVPPKRPDISLITMSFTDRVDIWWTCLWDDITSSVRHFKAARRALISRNLLPDPGRTRIEPRVALLDPMLDDDIPF